MTTSSTLETAPGRASGRRLPAAVVARVEREHAVLRALLDDLERALSQHRRGAPEGIVRLRRAAWELHVTFDEHVEMEETVLAPLLRMREGEARATAMILEHNEQRRVLCELVEDLESDVLDSRSADARTRELIDRLQHDIDVEDESLRRER